MFLDTSQEYTQSIRYTPKPTWLSVPWNDILALTSFHYPWFVETKPLQINQSSTGWPDSPESESDWNVKISQDGLKVRSCPWATAGIEEEQWADSLGSTCNEETPLGMFGFSFCYNSFVPVQTSDDEEDEAQDHSVKSHTEDNDKEWINLLIGWDCSILQREYEASVRKGDIWKRTQSIQV